MNKRQEYNSAIYIIHDEGKHRGCCLFSGLYLFLSIATLGALPLSVWLFKVIGRGTGAVFYSSWREVAKGLKFIKRLISSWWRILSEYRVTLDGRFLLFGGTSLVIGIWAIINWTLLRDSITQEAYNVSWVIIGCIFPLLLLVVIGGFGYWIYAEHRKVEELKRANDLLRSSAEHHFVQEWLASPPKRFRNEIEVEVKFVYPLLKMLGFGDDDLSVRERVQVRVGRQIVSGEADWVVRREGRPFLIVEAKEPGVALREEVSEQARSYAFALKAPYYMVTNGKALKLYRRGIERDEVIAVCDVDNLVNCWPRMEAQLTRR